MKSFDPSASARRTYEEQKKALEEVLESDETELRGMVQSHYRNAIENLRQLDEGTHFTQQADPTLVEDVEYTLNTSRKVIR